jgi:quinohemoprotein ethanol dehydrogenase
LRTIALFAVAAALAACQLTGPGPAAVDSARLARADATPGDWMTIGRTYDESFWSPLDRIDETNVADLGLAWFHDLDTFRGVEATPLVIDGVMYLISAWDITYAFDAATGELLWRYDPEVPTAWARYACCEPVSRGLAAWQGKIVIATLDGRLIALDAATGAPVWTTDTFADDWPYVITGAPRVFDGKVVIGSGGADLGVRGYVAAFDAEDGHELWRFYTVPGDPALGFENDAMRMAAETWTGEWWTLGGGGTAWDGLAYDPALNLVYIGTGNGSPLSWNHRSPDGGDNLFLASIVAVDADTGEYRWNYQTAPSDNWDYTSTAPMILADLEIEGVTRQVLMQAPKNGFFYVLDRATGELISAEPYAPNTWASHVDLETGRPAINPDAFFGTEPVLLTPGPGGAHNWWPMSFSPETGLVYFTVMQQYFTYSLDPNFTPRPFRPNAGWGFAGYPELRRELNAFASANEASWLTAWDPVLQQEAWRVEYPSFGSGGVLSTAGGLVFQGTVHQTLAAYRAEDGAKLWEAPANTIPIAAPMTYTVAGEQYVAIAAGWGGGVAAVERGGRGDRARDQARLLVFKLGGTAELPAFDPTTEPLSPPPPVTASEEQIQRGGQIYAENCALCHGPQARGAADRDLRYLDAETRGMFADIVLGGARAEQGMPSFEGVLSRDDLAAVSGYLAARANEDWGLEAGR